MSEAAADAAEALVAHLGKVLDAAEARTSPFRHWLLEDVLPTGVARAAATLPIAPPAIDDTLGKRDTHNATRVFFSVENQKRFPVASELARSFQAPETVRHLEWATGASFRGGSLRIEYCQDTDGFWLEPHTDIGAKLFTMLIYLSDAPEAENWGTDIYDRALRRVGAAPGGFNRGLFFVPGGDTWHGVGKRRFDGIRKTIIVNYVKPEWQARHELAFPDCPVD